MKQISIILGLIVITVMSGCELKAEDIKECTFDSECIITATEYCGDVIAINKEYQDRWYKQEIEPTKVKTPCVPDYGVENYEVVCRKSKCTVVQKKPAPFSSSDDGVVEVRHAGDGSGTLNLEKLNQKYFFDASDDDLRTNIFTDYDFQVMRKNSFFTVISFSLYRTSSQIFKDFDDIERKDCELLSYTHTMTLTPGRSVCIKTHEQNYIVLGGEWDGSTDSDNLRWKYLTD
jgi:hypothetical protein